MNPLTSTGRWGLPEDFRGAVIFLASKASDFMCGKCEIDRLLADLNLSSNFNQTGTSVVVDGGMIVK